MRRGYAGGSKRFVFHFRSRQRVAFELAVVVIDRNAFVIFDHRRLAVYFLRNPVEITVKGYISVLIDTALVFLVRRLDVGWKLYKIWFFLLKEL